MPGKIVKFDSETYNAVQQLAEDQRKTLQQIADEAFRDLLKKHGK
jgi:predicted transcriptional regulator